MAAKHDRQRRFNVYVIRLDEAVLTKPRFKKANPGYVDGKPCVYVGMSSLSPEDRFRNHLRGYKANSYVRRYGKYLMWRKFRRLNPMSYEEALEREKDLAARLRRRGFAVWQA